MLAARANQFGTTSQCAVCANASCQVDSTYLGGFRAAQPETGGPVCPAAGTTTIDVLCVYYCF
jgi:hypothetical protein